MSDPWKRREVIAPNLKKVWYICLAMVDHCQVMEPNLMTLLPKGNGDRPPGGVSRLGFFTPVSRAGCVSRPQQQAHRITATVGSDLRQRRGWRRQRPQSNGYRVSGSIKA